VCDIETSRMGAPHIYIYIYIYIYDISHLRVNIIILSHKLPVIKWLFLIKTKLADTVFLDQNTQLIISIWNLKQRPKNKYFTSKKKSQLKISISNP